MIIDRFENLDLYFDKESRLYKAVCFARDFDFSRSDGKYKVDGDDVFAECKTYFTKPVEERSFESHVKHIDVQVMLEGQEMMGHTLDKGLEVTREYSEEKDVQKYNRPEKYSPVVMKPGWFIVFFPQDLHMPDCIVDKQEKVRKLVVKVKV